MAAESKSPETATIMLLADDGAVVPGLEVGERDGGDGGVLGVAAVGAGRAVDEHGGFARGDAAGVVVAARDAGVDLALGELRACRP